MIDHVMLTVPDHARSRRFFAAALAPLGYSAIIDFDEVTGFGVAGKPDFWVGKGDTGKPLHIAFQAEDRATVDAFHAAALAAGATDNGGPGVRAQYHANYYGAFVLDPDGNNIEAVCHRP